MAAGGDFQGARVQEAGDSNAHMTVSSRIYAVVGTTRTLITRPDEFRHMGFYVEGADFRWRPGNYIAHTFVDGDVTVGTDTINDTAHGLVTNDGPYRLSSTGTLPAGLDGTTDYYIIKVDDDNYQFANSTLNANKGIPVDITAAVGTGTHSWSNSAFAIAATTDLTVGQNMLIMKAVTFGLPPIQQFMMAAPRTLTVEGAAVGSVMTFWFLP